MLDTVGWDTDRNLTLSQSGQTKQTASDRVSHSKLKLCHGAKGDRMGMFGDCKGSHAQERDVEAGLGELGKSPRDRNTGGSRAGRR